MRFVIDLTPRARDHLSDFRKRDQKIILDEIAQQLTHQADRPTRNRKKLEKNELAPWELRVGHFRVFYDVDRKSGQVVVLAIGSKIHNTLIIAGEEIDL